MVPDDHKNRGHRTMTWISFVAGAILGGITGIVIMSALSASGSTSENERKEKTPEGTDLWI